MFDIPSLTTIWFDYIPSRSSRLTKYVFMPQQHGAVDFSFSEPRLFISGGEDFHRHVLALPLASPHLSIPALTWRGKTNS